LFLEGCFSPLFHAYYHFPAQIWHTDYMHINVTQRQSRNKQKIYYNLEWGKTAGQRMSTGIFTYTKPKDQIQ